MQHTLEFILTTIITYFMLFGPIILTLYFINRACKVEQGFLQNISFLIVTVTFIGLFILGVIIQSFRLLLTQTFFMKITSNIPPISPATLSKFYLIGPAIWVPSFAALLILIPWIRQYVARLLPFSSKNPVHTLGLSLSMFVPILFLLNLIMGMNSVTYNQSEFEIIFSVWLQSLWLTLVGFFGVGWLSRLSFSNALKRLGIEKVSALHVGKGVLLGILLSFMVIVLESIASHYGLVNPKITKSTDELIGPLFNSIFGVLTLGLAAALGEETVFRGAILPRFGILYSSLLFALVHVHYGLSFQLVIVFLLGIILGKIRTQHNTTISMVVHATYNITLGIIGYLAAKMLT